VESLAAVANLMGAPQVPRATFDRGTFGRGNGTKLDVVSFQYDTLVRPAENEALYPYATDSEPFQEARRWVDAQLLPEGATPHVADLVRAVYEMGFAWTQLNLRDVDKAIDLSDAVRSS
jgi:hypothetical protein